MTWLELFLSLCIYGFLVNGELIELDNNFLQMRHGGPWLVKFYAPWCGHCRKMEPAYKEAAARLQGSEIRVARIDATQFVEVAANFQVRGYPTIKYIHGDRQFTHFGDRSVEGIVSFAKRAHRPAITNLASVGALHEAMEDNARDAMYVFLGAHDSPLHEAFKSLAEEFHIKSSFYSGEMRILPSEIVKKHQLTQKESSVLVFKDNTEFKFEVRADDTRPLNESLRAWIDAERFVAFPRLSEASIWEFSSTGKRVAVFVVNHSVELSEVDANFKAIGQKLATSHRDQFHDLYHFGWMDDLATASGLAMLLSLRPPNLLVLHPPSERFFLRADYHQPASEMTMEEVKNFLKDVAEDKVEGYGGKGFWARVKRLMFDVVTGLLDFITVSPLVALFVLGIPIGVVSLFVYLICCLEPAPDNEEFVGDDDQAHLRHMVSSHRLMEAPGGPTLHGDVKSPEGKKND